MAIIAKNFVAAAVIVGMVGYIFIRMVDSLPLPM